MKNYLIVPFIGLFTIAIIGGVSTASYGRAHTIDNKAEETKVETLADSQLSIAEIPPLPPIYIEQVATLKKGQTLSTILQRADLNNQDIHSATRSLRKAYNIRRMRPGAEFVYSYTESKEGLTPVLQGLSLYTNTDKHITVNRTTNDNFKSKVAKRPILRVHKIAQGQIKHSLYVAAQNAGLPDQLIVPFIELFSWDLDFTRDIRSGDDFRILFEEIHDDKGDFIRYGKVLAGEIDLTRKKKTVSAFRAPNGSYYDAKGLAKKKALLRTPLKFSRISSHFNPRRKHPVLKYTRAHKGTDFAASTGTPIKASGDGRIVEAGWKGGYGRYIRIRHNSTFDTAYAHMSRYGRGMKKGRFVKQGTVIGYVGMSGTATGPHLHYEVMRHGKKVNAMRVRLPSGKSLPKKMAREFKKSVASAKAQWLEATQIAQAGTDK